MDIHGIGEKFFGRIISKSLFCDVGKSAAIKSFILVDDKDIKMTKRPMLEEYQLESICRTIAATEGGLTCAEIGKILADTRIPDPTPGITKWQRLYNAFVESQNKYQCSNQVLMFILKAMQPVRYIGKEELFQYRRNEINKRLSFVGTELTERGTFIVVDKTKTVSEAEQRASHFKYKFLSRKVHDEIVKYCNAELLVENYFHSVFKQ